MILSNEPTHMGYSDEANFNTGRYRAVCAVTLETTTVKELNNYAIKLLNESSIKEFKWSKLRTAKYYFYAIKIVEIVFVMAKEGRLRVDTLVWDIADGRHDVQNRSDERNLRRMNYFLFKFILTQCWPMNAIWTIKPDESSMEPWIHINYLDEVYDWNTGKQLYSINIKEIVPSISHNEPIIQIADLFAGLAIYSVQSYDEYCMFKDDDLNHLSNSDIIRCKLLSHFYELSKANKLGVSLNKTKRLRTYNPKGPLNFWPYEPQSIDDKAPTWK